MILQDYTNHSALLYKLCSESANKLIFHKAD